MFSDPFFCFQYFEFECRADRVGLKCLKDMKERACLTPNCERELGAAKSAAEKRMRDYRCKEYGW